jgi:hypothetical protein
VQFINGMKNVNAEIGDAMPSFASGSQINGQLQALQSGLVSDNDPGVWQPDPGTNALVDSAKSVGQGTAAQALSLQPATTGKRTLGSNLQSASANQLTTARGILSTSGSGTIKRGYGTESGNTQASASSTGWGRVILAGATGLTKATEEGRTSVCSLRFDNANQSIEFSVLKRDLPDVADSLERVLDGRTRCSAMAGLSDPALAERVRQASGRFRRLWDWVVKQVPTMATPEMAVQCAQLSREYPELKKAVDATLAQGGSGKPIVAASMSGAIIQRQYQEAVKRFDLLRPRLEAVESASWGATLAQGTWGKRMQQSWGVEPHESVPLSRKAGDLMPLVLPLDGIPGSWTCVSDLDETLVFPTKGDCSVLRRCLWGGYIVASTSTSLNACYARSYGPDHATQEFFTNLTDDSPGYKYLSSMDLISLGKGPQFNTPVAKGVWPRWVATWARFYDRFDPAHEPLMICYRVFNVLLTPKTPELPVNSAVPKSVNKSGYIHAVARLPLSGQFVVASTWLFEEDQLPIVCPPGTFDAGKVWKVVYNIKDFDGNSVGPENRLVSTDTCSPIAGGEASKLRQCNPAVSGFNHGGDRFVVTWVDNVHLQIRARVFDVDGKPITKDILVKQFSSSVIDVSPRVHAFPSGLVIVWLDPPSNTVWMKTYSAEGQLYSTSMVPKIQQAVSFANPDVDGLVFSGPGARTDDFIAVSFFQVRAEAGLTRLRPMVRLFRNLMNPVAVTDDLLLGQTDIRVPPQPSEKTLYVDERVSVQLFQGCDDRITIGAVWPARDFVQGEWDCVMKRFFSIDVGYSKMMPRWKK